MFNCFLSLFVSVRLSDAYVNFLSSVVFFSLNFSFFDYVFICTPYQILFGTSNQGAWNEYGMMNMKRNVYTLFEELGLDGNTILKWIWNE